MWKRTCGMALLVAIVAVATPAVSVAAQGEERAGGPPIRALFGSMMAFRVFDTDEDGALAVDDVPEQMWDRLSDADSNEDAVVTTVEVSVHLASNAVDALDTDEDGVLSADEAPGPMLRLADADGDGAVTSAEIATAIHDLLFGSPAGDDGSGENDEMEDDGGSEEDGEGSSE